MIALHLFFSQPAEKIFLEMLASAAVIAATLTLFAWAAGKFGLIEAFRDESAASGLSHSRAA